ncbi:MAG: hypothetical protein PVF82_11575 [Gammaproteobacteria bacterium]
MKATHYEKTTDSEMERRCGEDRRRWNCYHDFPYVDSHGYLVVDNRRKNRDRRQLVGKVKHNH